MSIRKNNELLAQITVLNNQLQECTEENFRLRGEISTLQRTAGLRQARVLAFERERQTMLDLMDEVNRAVSTYSHLGNASD
jgi:regulator of replication initiation timing